MERPGSAEERPGILVSCTNGRGWIHVRFVRYAGLKNPRGVSYTTDILFWPDAEAESGRRRTGHGSRVRSSQGLSARQVFLQGTADPKKIFISEETRDGEVTSWAFYRLF